MCINKECSIFTTAAWQSTVPKTTHFISIGPETLVDVNGANETPLISRGCVV
jgi:hypothetical protein